MLERIAVSVALNEAVLLVGETGTGVYPSMGARLATWHAKNEECL
jgi:midasin (ATPase involved in ribosome maturation)